MGSRKVGGQPQATHPVEPLTLVGVDRLPVVVSSPMVLRDVTARDRDPTAWNVVPTEAGRVGDALAGVAGHGRLVWIIDCSLANAALVHQGRPQGGPGSGRRAGSSFLTGPGSAFLIAPVSSTGGNGNSALSSAATMRERCHSDLARRMPTRY